MWVIKAKGESYYVEHVTCEQPWTTKETPDNSHTKGSLKVKKCHLVIDENNHAFLKKLTPEIEQRLDNPEVIIRVISSSGTAFHKALANVEHVGVKHIAGACSSGFYITEFNSDEQYVMFKLSLEGNVDYRELKPNEDYYKMYEKYKHSEDTYIDEDEWYDDDDDDDGYESLYEN